MMEEFIPLIGALIVVFGIFILVYCWLHHTLKPPEGTNPEVYDKIFDLHKFRARNMVTEEELVSTTYGPWGTSRTFKPVKTYLPKHAEKEYDKKLEACIKAIADDILAKQQKEKECNPV